MEAAETFSVDVGTAASCRAFGVARSSLYRRRQPPPTVVRIPRASHRALSDVERQEVLDLLHSQRFVDQAPAQVAAALLDEERYLCSARTMYRILDANEEVRERRNQRRHPAYTRPELLATGPNQVWSWDITKLKGPRKWTYFYLYVILDIFSRQVVGWMVADCESASLAKTLIRASCDKQRIDRDQLILHADRGSSMKSKAVALLLSDLGITKSHSRPYVSDDNPFSEAQFKTLKYRPGFPERFGSIQDAKSFCRTFFNWYNNAHYHSGLNWLTPAMVHSGQTGPVLARRQHALDRARRQHPERFVNAPRKVAGVHIGSFSHLALTRGAGAVFGFARDDERDGLPSWQREGRRHGRNYPQSRRAASGPRAWSMCSMPSAWRSSTSARSAKRVRADWSLSSRVGGGTRSSTMTSTPCRRRDQK